MGAAQSNELTKPYQNLGQTVLTEIEKKLGPLQMNKFQLPKILLKDPAIGALKEMGSEAKPGDVIEIHRFSDNAGVNIAYRLVVEE